MGDKRQERLNVNRRIDNRVYLPAEMHIRLCSLPDNRVWKVTKFADSHSHVLSSPNKVHHFYSHRIHRSKVSRTIMTNLDDVRMRPSNIAHVVNTMNLEKNCERVSAQ